MNSKTLIGVLVVIILAGAAYWFYTDSQKESAANRLAEGSTAQDPNTLQAGGEVAPQNDPAMNGTWKSKEDPKFTREFKADGTVTDRYEGQSSATETGTYATINAALEAGLPVPAANLAGMTVIKTTWPKTGVMYFGVQSVTNTDLSLVNLSGRGNILTFTKVR